MYFAFPASANIPEAVLISCANVLFNKRFTSNLDWERQYTQRWMSSCQVVRTRHKRTVPKDHWRLSSCNKSRNNISTKIETPEASSFSVGEASTKAPSARKCHINSDERKNNVSNPSRTHQFPRLLRMNRKNPNALFKKAYTQLTVCLSAQVLI